MKRVIIRVKEIKGKCAVFKSGEKIVVDRAEINLEKTDNICIHALSSLLHHNQALREGVDPTKMGLAKEGKKSVCAVCRPRGALYEGGTVFEIITESEED